MKQSVHIYIDVNTEPQADVYITSHSKTVIAAIICGNVWLNLGDNAAAAVCARKLARALDELAAQVDTRLADRQVVSA